MRFGFGRNWKNFSEKIDGVALEQAQESLRSNYMEDLEDKTFLDIGSGSGLFSLAAIKAGAKVTSFDYDPESVQTTINVLEKYNVDTCKYSVLRDDILCIENEDIIQEYDFVYSWGVLHHTGNMYQAFQETIPLVRSGGKLFIAIYNDQGILSKFWLLVKFLYCTNWLLAILIIAIFSPYFYIRSLLRVIVKRTKIPRGMSTYNDMLDWLGGYPFEVAKPKEVINFFEENGYELFKCNLVGRKLGCNEFIFRRIDKE